MLSINRIICNNIENPQNVLNKQRKLHWKNAYSTILIAWSLKNLSNKQTVYRYLFAASTQQCTWAVNHQVKTAMTASICKNMERIWKILTDITLAGNDTLHGNYRPQLKESPHERERFQRPNKKISRENMSRVLSEYMNILINFQSHLSEDLWSRVWG